MRLAPLATTRGAEGDNLDIASIIGLLLGLVAIVGGALIEGLMVRHIYQPTAGLIVFGGTCGAVLLSFPLKIVVRALKALEKVMKEPKTNDVSIVNEIIGYANKARKDGLISLENALPRVSDPFLRRALSLAVDGTDPKVMRETMEIELDHLEEEWEQEARVFEGAGGYAPTIGILGAVLGLIHVMDNLADPNKLGGGIAVAFVATVYGVGSANLIFLPISAKLKVRMRHAVLLKEMMLEGVAGMLEGINPRIIEERLKGFLSSESRIRIGTRSIGERTRIAA
jgi:chemotaxis protein MotA